MFIVHVSVHVKPDRIDDFKAATAANHRASLKEPGVLRFDVIQERERPDRFLLVEVYRTDEDPARHKETQHYLTWRETVAGMMASPRTSVKYQEILPLEASGWSGGG